jgi:hypothetical protein
MALLVVSMGRLHVERRTSPRRSEPFTAGMIQPGKTLTAL